MSIECVIGDCREVLKTLPDNSINCCVTSPPYFGLRDYGHENQIGLERTPDDYVNELVKVFGEVRRVLLDDGTVWLNIGDSYASSTKAGNKVFGNAEFNINRPSRVETKTPEKQIPTGLKPKDLIGIPWRVAFARQADGWYLRQDIIWAKGNPMPESVKDRCTKSHEYIFLLSKSARYYFDSDAIKEPAAYDGRKDTMMKGSDKYANSVVPGKKEHTMAARGHERWQRGINGEFVRNKRSVWNINTTPYKGAHFATFPKQLVEPCILAGCPVGGTVLDPFGGSGTVGEVCRIHQRNAVLIELNPEYEPLIKQRIGADVPELTSFGVIS